jgi:hypothetical protein
MTFGTVLWNITEYLAYVGIIIQTGLVLLEYAGLKIPTEGAAGGQSIIGYINEVVGALGTVIENQQNKQAPAPVHRRRR